MGVLSSFWLPWCASLPVPFPILFEAKMALNLLYRSTFIDVEEYISFPESPRRKPRRASSAPPTSSPEGGSRATMLSVGALAVRAQQLHTMLRLKQAPVRELWSDVADSDATEASSQTASEECKEPKTEPVEPVSPQLGQWPSVGSLRHPEICRRPCMYFVAGACSNGAQCDYCHLPHDQRPTHLDKRQRELLNGFSEPQLIALLLRYLEAKARTHGFISEAAELLALLRHQAHLAAGQQLPEPNVPGKAWPKFDYMMQRMTFQALVGWAMKSRTSTPEFIEQVTDAMARMRRTLLA
ncbi:unnamed protein product [Effrenium voratum]|nr:unnamed protein product [Effrenium voratum]